MNAISISDVTMKRSGRAKDFELSFKEKIDLGRILDQLNVNVIELDAIENKETDSLLLKSLAATVKNSIIAVPVGMDVESVTTAAAALEEAKAFRLQVVTPVSPVQMEYLCHKKPEKILKIIEKLVAACKKYTNDVEFIAADATRAEKDFVVKAVEAAIDAGATTITLCDTAGCFLPDECVSFIKEIEAGAPSLKNVSLGLFCDNNLAMADACMIAAVENGVSEIKAAACGDHTASLKNVVDILGAKAEALTATCSVRHTELHRAVEKIEFICHTFRSKKSPFDNGAGEDEPKIVALNSRDDMATVLAAVKKLGYDLSEEDSATVYDAFLRIAVKKESVSSKELDTIVATVAMQVPPTYRVESYVLNSGNIITATAHIKLWKNDTLMEGISTGDGPIDAAFLAIEQITGHHYELDEFQIQAVTEGREAMGETIVKLRDEGKIFSGRGISTDIIGSSIRAYVNALNKIVYEED